MRSNASPGQMDSTRRSTKPLGRGLQPTSTAW
jgi:hypothetical protein